MRFCVENFRFEGDGSQIPIWSRWVLNLVWGQIVIDWLHRKSSNDLKVILTCKLSWESLMGRFRKEFLSCQGSVQLLYTIFLQNIIFLKKMWFLENTPKNKYRINILSFVNGNKVEKHFSMVIWSQQKLFFGLSQNRNQNLKFHHFLLVCALIKKRLKIFLINNHEFSYPWLKFNR